MWDHEIDNESCLLSLFLSLTQWTNEGNLWLFEFAISDTWKHTKWKINFHHKSFQPVAEKWFSRTFWKVFLKDWEVIQKTLAWSREFLNPIDQGTHSDIQSGFSFTATRSTIDNTNLYNFSSHVTLDCHWSTAVVLSWERKRDFYSTFIHNIISNNSCDADKFNFHEICDNYPARIFVGLLSTNVSLGWHGIRKTTCAWRCDAHSGSHQNILWPMGDAVGSPSFKQLGKHYERSWKWNHTPIIIRTYVKNNPSKLMSMNQSPLKHSWLFWITFHRCGGIS